MKKGQFLSLEQMFLFTIGLIIAVSIFLAFSKITDNVRNMTDEDQMKEIGDMVLAGITNVFVSDTDYASLNMNIPKKISGKGYKVKIDGKEIIVELDEKETRIPLTGLNESYNIGGEVFSSVETILIEKTPGNIVVGKYV